MGQIKRIKLRHVVPGALALVALAAAGTAIAGSDGGGKAGKVNLGTVGGLNYRAASAENPPGRTTKEVAHCAGGKHVTGGGVQTTSTSQYVNETRPYDNRGGNRLPDDGWIAFVGNSGGTTHAFTVYAICVR
jgi:hypothetical protein